MKNLPSGFTVKYCMHVILYQHSTYRRKNKITLSSRDKLLILFQCSFGFVLFIIFTKIRVEHFPFFFFFLYYLIWKYSFITPNAKSTFKTMHHAYILVLVPIYTALVVTIFSNRIFQSFIINIFLRPVYLSGENLIANCSSIKNA